jgi:hypothetical protein
MKATVAQKHEILVVLIGFCEGQLNGAALSLEEDFEGAEGAMMGHVADAADMLGVVREFAEHGDMQQMLVAVNGRDTLVREDVYEGLQDCEVWDVLRTLEGCYYKD